MFCRVTITLGIGHILVIKCNNNNNNNTNICNVRSVSKHTESEAQNADLYNNGGSYLAFKFLSRNEFLLGILQHHFGKMNPRNEAVNSLSDRHGNAAGVNCPHRTLRTCNNRHVSCTYT